jgi:hypothetical protein
MALGHLSNMVAAGDEFGNVFLWKDPEALKEHVGNNFQIHASNV